METKTFTTIDRSEWPSGPWDGEPDKMQWPDKETGMPCLAVRNRHMGFWCGYVGVSADHPLFGKHYDQASVDVHGGLTFSDVCHPHETEATGICHVPGEGEPDNVWWLGFDCGHAWDNCPHTVMSGFASHDCSYKSLRFVQNECAGLAEQLVAIAATPKD